MHGKPGRLGEGGEARRCSRAPGCSSIVASASSSRPAAFSHSPRSMASHASSDSQMAIASVLPISAAAADASAKTARASSRLPGEQVRLAEQPQRACRAMGSRRAPGRRRRRRRPSSAPGRRRTCTARNMARAESKEADPSDRHTVERGSVHDRRPPLRPCRVAGQHGLPAPQHGQRRVAFDVHIADRASTSAERSPTARPCRSAGPARPPAAPCGPSRWCAAGALGPAPGNRWTSYQSAARWCSVVMMPGSVRRSSPSRNSRNSAW